MNAPFCQYEDELLDGLGRGYIHEELAAHVQSCTSCNELQLVAGAVLDERVQAFGEAPLPTSSTMWWRMQLRHRQEAQATARRSLFIGQALTLTVVLGLIGSLLGSDVAVGARDVATGAREVVAALRVHTPIALAVATFLLLMPIAGYVAVKQK